jgi:hypothetical protein
MKSVSDTASHHQALAHILLSNAHEQASELLKDSFRSVDFEVSVDNQGRARSRCWIHSTKCAFGGKPTWYVAFEEVRTYLRERGE